MASSYFNGRKRHRRLTVEQAIAYVREAGVVSVSDVASHFDVAPATARSKLDSGVYRGEIVRDEYDDAGEPLGHLDWRYCEVA